MPFGRVAETRICQAIADGEFDNLPGAGKPLNLDDYFATPEDLRMAFSILKNANCAPAEVEMLKEISRLEHVIEGSSDEAERYQLRRKLAHRRTELAMALERGSSRR